MKEDYDVDIVILWVDGNDENWQKEKNKYVENRDNSKDIVRYRDWEILQYWFRGIEKYMPWVRKIHFVTWGHLPQWLNINHPKLHIVKHTDFIPKKYLPTFNSPVIEMNIHRIEGLAEHFIYFNDDMFALRKMKKEDFFVNGQPCDTAIMNTISYVPGAENESFIQFNNTGVINRHFNKKLVLKNNFKNWFSFKYGKQLFRNILLYNWPYFTGFYTCHIPTSMLLSSFKEIWEKEENLLDNMCYNKFRSTDMVNQWVVSNWQMCSGKFYPRNSKFGLAYELTENLENNKVIFNVIKNQKNNIICINDYIYDEKLYDSIKNDLQDSFQTILPEKSDYEI